MFLCACACAWLSVLNVGAALARSLSEAVCVATAVTKLVPVCVSALHAQSWYCSSIPSTEIPGWAPAAWQGGSGLGSGGSGPISHGLTFVSSQYIEDNLPFQLLIYLSLNVCFESLFAEALLPPLF